jgi:DNA-binding transcriptional LysR family regulator
MNSIHSKMDLNLLRVFHTVHTERSVSLAAERLGLTQSAVSHGLRKLRLIFKDELFVRSGQAMIPTSRGQALFEPVQRIMETLQNEVMPVAVFDGLSARREFSLAMVDMAEVVFIPPLMRFLRVNAPHCTLRTLRLPNEAMIDALERGNVELAIANVPGAHGNIYSQTMFLHDYVVIAWEKHPRIKSRLSWAAYQREEHIVVNAGSDVSLQESTLVPRGIKRKVVLTVGGFLSIPWLIQGTEMIATVPTRLSEGITQAAMVKQLALPEPAKPYGLQSVWHPRSHNDPGHRWLREALFKIMNYYPNTD